MKRIAYISLLVAMILGAIQALAGTVSGIVDDINVLSGEQFFTDISGDDSANLGATDVKIASGVINSNSTDGWKLTVTSVNNGNLVKAGFARKILYTNIKLDKTGGDLGAGLTDPSGGSKSVVSGSCVFNTATKAATTATVDYAFELKISWSADFGLLSGTYEDTVTMTLAVDI